MNYKYLFLSISSILKQFKPFKVHRPHSNFIHGATAVKLHDVFKINSKYFCTNLQKFKITVILNFINMYESRVS